MLATDALANTVTVGPRERLLARELVVDRAILRRDGDCVDGVRVRAHGRRFPCRVPEQPPAGEHRRLVLELAEPTERTAPGQIACLYRGEVVVGYGTIAA